MSKRNLTDRTLKALRATKPGTHADTWDTTVSGFGVRVSETGRRTFILMARYPGSRNPTRRAIGVYGEMSLADARAKAIRWRDQIRKGIDPAVAEEEARLAALRRQENSFAAVVGHYLRQHVIGPDSDKPKQRNGREVERDFARTFIPVWGERPITSITNRDVREIIEDVRDYGTATMLARKGIKEKNGKKMRVAARAPGQARNLLSYLKTFFSWAIERDDYGLEISPCDRLKAARLIGPRESDHRILDDLELFAFWRATQRLGYPFGPLYRLLLLSGLRLNEVADATWTEFDLAKAAWTIPAERMKGKPGKAKPHVVPLTAEMLEILCDLPRFNRGEYLFSSMFGERPVWVNDKIKKRLDQRMLHTLRALARSRGDDPGKVKLNPWVNHDLRRTLRSRLSELRVNSDVAEAVLAHVKPGIRGVYDRYEYFDEKRHALDAWSARLRGIVEPPPKNVIELHAARA